MGCALHRDVCAVRYLQQLPMCVACAAAGSPRPSPWAPSSSPWTSARRARAARATARRCGAAVTSRCSGGRGGSRGHPPACGATAVGLCRGRWGSLWQDTRRGPECATLALRPSLTRPSCLAACLACATSAPLGCINCSGHFLALTVLFPRSPRPAPQMSAAFIEAEVGLGRPTALP
jgi:hypothetical protein